MFVVFSVLDIVTSYCDHQISIGTVVNFAFRGMVSFTNISTSSPENCAFVYFPPIKCIKA